MSNGPVDTIKVGQCEIAKWASEFEGKPTVSYSLRKQKFDKTTKTYVESKFLGVTDLKDILVACQMMLLKHYTPEVKVEEAPF